MLFVFLRKDKNIFFSRPGLGQKGLGPSTCNAVDCNCHKGNDSVLVVNATAMQQRQEHCYCDSASCDEEADAPSSVTRQHRAYAQCVARKQDCEL